MTQNGMYLCLKCNIEKDYGSMAELMPDPICVECHLLSTGDYKKCKKCNQSILKKSNFHMCTPLTQHAIDHPLKKFRFKSREFEAGFDWTGTARIRPKAFYGDK